MSARTIIEGRHDGPVTGVTDGGVTLPDTGLRLTFQVRREGALTSDRVTGVIKAEEAGRLGGTEVYRCSTTREEAPCDEDKVYVEVVSALHDPRVRLPGDLTSADVAALRGFIHNFHGAVAAARTWLDVHEAAQLTWEDARRLIPRDRPADTAVMQRFVTPSNGKPIFQQSNDREDFEWYADARGNPVVAAAYDVCRAFVGDHGGNITWQLVAMLSLAADADGVRQPIPKRDAAILVGGAEEGSPKFVALQKKFPTLNAAIASFF